MGNVVSNFFVFVLFLAGLNFLRAYLLGALLIFFYIILVGKKIKIKKFMFFIWFFGFFGFVFPFFIGMMHGNVNVSNDQPLTFVLIHFFNLFLLGYIFSLLSCRRQTIGIIALSVGFFLSSVSSVFYSISQGVVHGYGAVYLPFSDVIVNSPMFSMSLVPISILIIYFLFEVKSGVLYKFLSLLVLLLAVFCGAFLGGRTYFLCLFIYLFFIVFCKFTIKKIFLVFFVVLIAFIFLYVSKDLLASAFDLLSNRFSNGLESKRWMHYRHGFFEMLNNPLGGFSVDDNIENTKWFHNILIDAARLGGWISFVSIIIIFALPFEKAFVAREIFFPFSLFCIAFLLMMQDVILEGHHGILFFSLLCIINIYSRGSVKSESK